MPRYGCNNNEVGEKKETVLGGRGRGEGVTMGGEECSQGAWILRKLTTHVLDKLSQHKSVH